MRKRHVDVHGAGAVFEHFASGTLVKRLARRSLHAAEKALLEVLDAARNEARAA